MHGNMPYRKCMYVNTKLLSQTLQKQSIIIFTHDEYSFQQNISY